jgi:hypothetical protein
MLAWPTVANLYFSENDFRLELIMDFFWLDFLRDFLRDILRDFPRDF